MEPCQMQQAPCLYHSRLVLGTPQRDTPPSTANQGFKWAPGGGVANRTGFPRDTDGTRNTGWCILKVCAMLYYHVLLYHVLLLFYYVLTCLE